MEKHNQLISNLQRELHDLNVKLGKLNHVLVNSDEFEISEQQLGLMDEQANAMQKYSNILVLRINALESIK